MRTATRLAAIAAIALVATAFAHSAMAAIVSGSFAGIARDELIFNTGPVTPAFDGATVQGRFRIDTSLLGPQTVEDPEFATYRLLGDALLLRFSVLGATYSFGNQGLASTGTVFTAVGGQALLFGANVLDTSFPTALLRFGGTVPDGAPGLFADGLDLTTLHAAPVDLGQLGANGAAFQLTQNMGARVELTDLRFDDPHAVPEPAAWVLVLTGLALCRRHRAAVVNGPQPSPRR